MSATLLGRPHAFERGDKVYLTTPLTIVTPTESEVEEFAFASAVRSKAPNENIGWLQGRYVEAGKPNLNGAMWLSSELAVKALTPMLMPITVMHDPRTAVGVIADCKLIDMQPGSTTSRIDTILAQWKHRFPDVWEEACANVDSGTMMQSMECVPLDSEILTRRGWKRYDELRPGDETIGYNTTTGRNEWTAIVNVVRKRAEIFDLFTGKWRARCTGAHAWLTKTGTRKGTKFVYEGADRVDARDLGHQHQLILTALADLDDNATLPITPAEAAVIAWIAGDGSIRSHRGGKDFQACIHQSKPDGVMAVELALADAGIEYTVTEKAPQRHDGAIKQTYAMRTYYLPAARARDIWLRAELDHLSWVTFITQLSGECRAAFMEAIYQAKGNENHGSRCIAQNPGPLKDAIALGGYLEGFRPVSHMGGDNSQPTSHVRLARAPVNGGKLRMISLGEGEVWCPTTELGTWTMRQDDCIMLTGNCYAPYYSCSECSQQYVKLPNGAERASWCAHLRGDGSSPQGWRILGDVCFTGTGLIFGTRGGIGAYTEAHLDHFHSEIAEYHDRAHVDGNYKATDRSARQMSMVQIEDTELARLKSERDEARKEADALKDEKRELTTRAEVAEAAKLAAETAKAEADKAIKDLEEKAQHAELKEKRIGALGAGFMAKLGETSKAVLNELAAKSSDDEWERAVAEREELAGVKRDAQVDAGGKTATGTTEAAGKSTSFADEEVASALSRGFGASQTEQSSSVDGQAAVSKLARAFKPKATAKAA